MPNTISDTSTPEETVACRPSVELWGIIGLAFFFSLMCALALILPSTPPPAIPAAQNLFFGICCVGSFLAGIVTLWWMLHARMLADSDGLRWRGLGGWKSVSWNEVTDYYYRLPAQPRGGRPRIRANIITASGTLSFNPRTQSLNRTWTEIPALLDKVTREATSAAAKEWSLLGSRPCDSWPRVFRYNTWQNIWMPRLILPAFLVFFVSAIAKPVMQTVQLTGAVGWPMKVALFCPYLMLLLLSGSHLLLIILQYCGAGQRKAERITADLAGIVFEDNSQRVEASWLDVTRYWMAEGENITNQYRVETKEGKFDFLSSISDAVLLQQIIWRFAAEADTKDWNPPVSYNALGGEATRWSGGKIGVGARVYHYRNRTNRALLWMPLMLCFVFGLMAWLGSQGQLPGQNVFGMAWSGAGSGLMLLLGYCAYHICRIETDEEGMTQITLLGRHHLRWAQIENYFLTKERGGVVCGRGRRLRFSVAIVGYEELLAEIKQRATECGGKEWRCLPRAHEVSSDAVGEG